MKKLWLITLGLLMTGFTTMPPIPSSRLITRKQTVLSQGAGAELLIKKNLVVLPPSGKTNIIQFKYPSNVNLTKWHDTMLWVSVDGTNWSKFGKNVIQTKVMVPKMFYRQEIL